MRRRFIILLAMFLVVVIGSIGAVWVVKRSPKLQQAIENTAHINRPVNNAVKVLTNSNPTTNPSIVDQDAVGIKFTARNFTERYGSDSNQSDYAGLISAETWGTTRFNGILNQNIALQRVQAVSPTYHGFISRVMVVTIIQQLASAATVVVSTQRVETTGTDTKTYNQDLQLNLLKINNLWYVDAANWKPVT